jgi:bacterial/archaeal transporter family protein
VRWAWLAVCVLSGTGGDLMSAKGMAAHGELECFSPRRMAQVLRYIVTHPLIVAGIASDAVSFLSLIALLSVVDVSFAIPATAVSYILKTALARWYLGECISWRRWAGAACVAVGVYLISK